MQSLRRTIFNAPRSSLLATSRLPCSASSPTATTIRHYGGTGAQHKGESHGGQVGLNCFDNSDDLACAAVQYYPSTISLPNAGGDGLAMTCRSPSSQVK